MGDLDRERLWEDYLHVRQTVPMSMCTLYKLEICNGAPYPILGRIRR
jgi:hypothetical protein